MEEINLKELLNFFKKKFKLFISIFLLVCVGGGVYSAFIQKPDYQSYTTVILGSGASTITQSDVTLNKSLVDTYSEVVKSRRVLNQVIEELDLDTTYDSLASHISVSDADSSQIIKITVKSGNPTDAQNIANVTAEYFIKEVVDLYKLENVNVLDEAIRADEPYNNNFTKQAAIYAIIGLVLGAAVVFVVFYFDGSVQNAEQVEDRLKLAVLGKVHESVHLNSKNELVVVDHPKAAISEDIRTIRTNLQLSLSRNRTKTILTTSSVPSEGKSFISANLAAAFAQAGKKTLLIDSDLRRGRVHEVFGIANKHGLADYLVAAGTRGSNPEFSRYTNKSKTIANLTIVTRGVIPANPSELLSSSAFKKLISALRPAYDCIILDGPPIQGLPDSLIMSNVVDGTVIVCANGFTSVDVLNSTKKALANVGAKISGVVVNRSQSASDKYSKYNKYYGAYYGAEKKK